MNVNTEIRVGLFVIAALALLVVAWVWSWDGVRPGEDAYRVHTEVATADGLWPGTPVRLAGVEIGSIHDIGVAGTRAHLGLDIRSGYPLPADSTVELRSTGMLGDRFVAIAPGTSNRAVADGGTLREGGVPFDMDATGREAQRLAAELNLSAAAVREVITNEDNVRHLEESLAQLADLTATLAQLAARNQNDIDTVVRSLRHMTGETDALVTASSPQIQAELAALQQATDRLNAVLDDVASITGRVERGEGTLGALIHERTLADNLDRTLTSTNAAMDSVGGILGDGPSTLKADAWTMGRVFAGPDGLLTGGTLGAELGASDAMWLSGELVVPPAREAVPVRGSLQLHRRWGPGAVFLGMKEGSEGLGGALYAASDRLRVQADAFDFLGRTANRPDGMPNLRLGLRAEPLRYLWVEAAAEELLLGVTEGAPQGWIGLGFHLDAPGRGSPDDAEPVPVPVVEVP